MNKKLLALISLLIIVAFIGYIVYDTVRPAADNAENEIAQPDSGIPDQWMISQELFIGEGLKAASVAEDGSVITGNEKKISFFSSDLREIWKMETVEKIRAIAVYGDTIYAASEELIFLISRDGKLISEWGPYEANCLITSITANRSHVAIADAGNKIVFILRKSGDVKSMVGHFEEKLKIPSPYFDVYLTADNTLYMAHTGSHRIEKRNIEGRLLSWFGDSGTGPDEFCGCCNPAHFAVMPWGFVTAEKGINRLKILGAEGNFVEYVSSKNRFIASMPLDVATADGVTIYGANPADGKLYVFRRK